MLDLYLIRHGESSINLRNDLIGGRTNHAPLSENGKMQAKELGEYLVKKGISFNRIYSSTAVRTKETAKIICNQTGYSLDEIVFSEDLLELSQGNWEGLIRKEIYTPEILEKLNLNSWDFKPPNGESQKQVGERMYTWMEKNPIKKYEQEPKVAVISHGMAIKCLLKKIMDFSPKLTYKILLDNTSITRLQYSQEGWSVIKINDTPHLN